jgi:hypothetical protein
MRRATIAAIALLATALVTVGTPATASARHVDAYASQSIDTPNVKGYTEIFTDSDGGVTVSLERTYYSVLGTVIGTDSLVAHASTVDTFVHHGRHGAKITISSVDECLKEIPRPPGTEVDGPCLWGDLEVVTRWRRYVASDGSYAWRTRGIWTFNGTVIFDSRDFTEALLY